MAESNSWVDFISRIQPKDTNDKLVGMIYGHILGDIMGQSTSFRQRPTESAELSIPDIIDWTDNTDYFIITMRSLTDRDMQYNISDILSKLHSWVNCDNNAIDHKKIVSPIMKTIINDKEFINSPYNVASNIHAMSQERFANNECLMRIGPLVAIKSDDNSSAALINEHEKVIVSMTSITHKDSRCVSACIFYGLILHNIIYSDASNIDEIISQCVARSRKYIDKHDNELSEYIRVAFTRPISELKLSNVNDADYIFKCLGAITYTIHIIKCALDMQKTPDFKKVITKVANECGDSCANCAVSGALMGAYLGYNHMITRIEDWITILPNRGWLNQIIMQFLNADQ